LPDGAECLDGRIKDLRAAFKKGVTLMAVMHDMPITVKDDRILIGFEFVPRRLDLPRVLVIPKGQTVVAPSDSTWDYIEVRGTLRVSRDFDTICRFTHLIVLPGGVLDIGTEADPVARRVELIIRDVPIDTSRDPFQWGNGLLNFGRQTRVGTIKTSRVDVKTGLPAGQTQITLPETPNGWQVGDEVLIPDTLPQASNRYPAREAKVTIAALSGTSLTLSKALDFAHPPIIDPHGVAYLYPCVYNLTRNLEIRSENASGTPGHTANIGMDATWDIRANLLVGLGRTRAEKHDVTSVDLKHIGTNQLGKYADHDHHAHGFGSQSINNVYVGHPRAKWARVIHGTHDSLVEDNIALDFVGAGFVTEDGYEVRNVFRRNVALYNFGTFVVDNLQTNLDHDAPGIEGTGFWLHGVMNTFEDNEARCCRSGFVLINQQLKPGKYPSQPGMMPDTPYQGDFGRSAVPVSCKRQVTACNFGSGFETWQVAKFPNIDMVTAYNGDAQFLNFAAGFPHLINPTVLGEGGRSYGLHVGMAYSQGLLVEGGVIAGCAHGLSNGGGAASTKFVGTRLQNAENIDLRYSGALNIFTDVLHAPLAGFEPRYIMLGSGKVWNGQEPLPFDGAAHLPPCRGSQYFIHNWQGTKQDFLLFHNQQLASNPAPYTKSDTPQHAYGVPEKGLTIGEGWAKYGLAYRGEALAEADKVVLEGLIGGYARKGLVSPLGPPSAVVMSPTMREPAPTESHGVKLYIALTGDFTKADSNLYYKTDDRPVAILGPQSGVPLDGREFFGPAAEGTHTLVLFRKDLKGQKIAASERTFQYFVGPTPPSAQVHVPKVIGLTQAEAATAIAGAQLTVGTPSTVSSATVLAGTVISQSPDVGSSATVGSAVSVVVSSGPTLLAPPPTPVGDWRPVPFTVEQFGADGQLRVLVPGLPEFEPGEKS
jgi:hypothetical protein